MSLDRELEAMARPRKGFEKVQRWAERTLFKRRRHAAYCAVFLDGSGEVSEAGRIVINDLANMAGLGQSGDTLPADQLRAREGRRAVVLRLIDSLHMDEAKIARMARQFREMQDE